MGQYYYIANLDKREFLSPHNFGDGLKLLEFGCSARGVLTALTILLADGNNRGGGDLRSDNPIIGSWAGNRIVIAGDYGDAGKFIEGIPHDTLQAVANEHYAEGYQDSERVNLYALIAETFKNIDAEALAAMLDDDYLREEIEKQVTSRYASPSFLEAFRRAEKIKACISSRHNTS